MLENIKLILNITDDIPVFQHFKSRGDGTYHPFGESCYVVFSLTDKYSNDGKYYKMAAQFFEDN